MESFVLPFPNASLRYFRMGQGKEWLFCFHGYGEQGSSFGGLEHLLGEKYTLIAFDFPFHGETEWPEGILLEPSDLVQLINQIKPLNQPMSLLGYSMGGRVALQLAQIIPQQINRILLLAPDGLHKNKWQWLSTKTKAGNRLFAHTMRNPGWMMGLLKLASTLGLFNKSLHKFVHYYLDDAAQRQLLYRRWTTMRKFSPKLALLKKILIKHQIPLQIVFGKYDRVIVSKHGYAFRKNAASLITVTELESGHQLLKDKYAPLIAQWLGCSGV